MISIIVAIAQNYAIGKNNDLLWHISADLKRFKALTIGHPVIMGSRTFESLSIKPLPKRRNIVVTRNFSFTAEGCDVVHSLAEALEAVAHEEEAFVIGGGNIYEQFIPFAKKMQVTWIHQNFEGDTFFPEINMEEWTLCEESELQHDESSGLDFSFRTYQREKSKDTFI